MGRASTSRVILHAMWVSVVAAMPAVFAAAVVSNALDHDADFGRGLDAAVLAMVLFVPFWVPPVILGAVLVGLAAAGTDRALYGRALGIRVGAAATAGALAATAAMAGVLLWLAPGSFQALPGLNSGLGVEVLAGVTIGAVGGGMGLFLADRSRIDVTITAWGVAAAAVAAATVFIAILALILAKPWDPVEDCAMLLGVGESGVWAVEAGLPPQTWCVSLDTVQKWRDVWAVDAVWVAGAASLACAVISAGGGWGRSRRPAAAVFVTAGAVIIVGCGLAAWAANASPTAAQIEQAREEIRSNQSRLPSDSPTGPASPPGQPDISAQLVRADLNSLVRIAQTSAGPEVLWPTKPRISTVACTLPSGRSGVMISSTARFTTRYLADVHGPDEMLALEHANEKVAERIAEAWSASGDVSDGEPIHGEWGFSSGADNAIETAHLGFTDGIGEFQIASYCAHR